MTVWHVWFFVVGAGLAVWSIWRLQSTTGRIKTDSVRRGAEPQVGGVPRLGKRVRNRLLNRQYVRLGLPNPKAWFASTRRILQQRATHLRNKRTANRRLKWRPLRGPKFQTHRFLIHVIKRKRTQPGS